MRKIKMLHQLRSLMTNLTKFITIWKLSMRPLSLWQVLIRIWPSYIGQKRMRGVKSKCSRRTQRSAEAYIAPLPTSLARSISASIATTWSKITSISCHSQHHNRSISSSNPQQQLQKNHYEALWPNHSASVSQIVAKDRILKILWDLQIRELI